MQQSASTAAGSSGQSTSRLQLPDVDGLPSQVHVIRRVISAELRVSFFGGDILIDCREGRDSVN
jgi:hypothetical protein